MLGKKPVITAHVITDTLINNAFQNTLYVLVIRCHLRGIYRVSQEECAILRESVPYVKLCRYNPKHLYPKLNGYGDIGQRKVWTSGVSTYCTPSVTSYSSNVHARQREHVMQWPWQTFYSTVALTSQDNAVCVKYLEAQGQIREKCECFCSSI